MLKGEGVYTAKCPECSRSILIHLLSDGSISPNKCPGCEMGFEGINKGEQRSTFVIVAKTKQSKIVDNVVKNGERRSTFVIVDKTKQSKKMKKAKK